VFSIGRFGKKKSPNFLGIIDTQETCYFVEGDVIVTPDGG
jgi:uncharacterized cupin superfamily protein